MRQARRAIAVGLTALLLCGATPDASGRRRRRPKAGKVVSAKRPVNLAPRGETELERQLQDDLDGILSSRLFARAQNGVFVLELGSERLLYSAGADRQLNPASNVKVVSTAAALDALGPEFTFRTRILGPEPDPAGVVAGDVYLVGMADPMLELEHMGEIARALASQGIRRIEGALAVGEGEARDAVVRPRVAITVVGGEHPGDVTSAAVSPESDYFIIDNDSVTGKPQPARPPPRKKRGNKRHKAKRRHVSGPGIVLKTVRDPLLGPQTVVRITGKLSPGQRATVVREVPHPALFTAHVLRTQILAAGIEITGGVTRAPEPASGLVELAAHDSLPLGVLVAKVNKPSWNFLADRVIETVGAQLYGGEPSSRKGVRAMEAYLVRIGLGRASYRLDNGSGLSYTSHLSARQVAAVLAAAWNDFRVAPDFVASLAVAGRDGTLRGRFRSGARGWVRAKTGTLTRVSALSGFVSSGDGNVLLFAILNNRFPARRVAQVRAGQGAMVEAIYRFLRRRAERAAPSELPVVEAPAEEIPAEEDSGPEEAQEPDVPAAVAEDPP